jgi:putative membrane protein
MALVFGIYERLIELLSELFRCGISLIRLDLASFRSGISAVEWGFLVSLFVGVLIAPLLGAALIPDLLETWPQESRSLFFGLILGTIPIPWLRISDHQLKNVLVLMAAAVVSFILVGIPPLEVTDPGLWAVFGAAVLAICAALLPGISGAFVLLILGMYTPIFDAINERNFIVLFVFALGAGIGLGSFSVVLKSLLARAHDVTMAALVGLMLGSLRSLWPWLAADRSLLQPNMGENFSAIVWLGLLGLLLSVGMTAWEMKKSKRGARD